MNLTSLCFLFAFLPALLMILYLLRRFHASDLIVSGLIAAASLLFYAWGGLANLLILLTSSLINYMLSRLISHFASLLSVRRIMLWIGIILNIGLLAVYRFLPNAPLGLSFFAFVSVAYITDVYWEKTSGEHNLIRYIEYIFFFPKVCMGPITRYGQLAEDLHCHRITENNTYLGIRRFCIGFSKKILLANQMGAAADAMFEAATAIPAGYAWIGLLSYTLQIYLDFSSYTDMAIGLGLILGIRLPENFNYPYIAKNIQDFWRRWHISLSLWFRDYVYIPLGGNRRGKLRTYCNLLTVFLLTGIWHGASWSFVIWGLFHGIFQLLERSPLGRLLKKAPSLLQHLYTMLIVMAGWVFFRSDTLTHALTYFKSLAGTVPDPAVSLNMMKALTPQYYFFLGISLLAAFPIAQRIPEKWKAHWSLDCILLLVFVLAVCYMAAGNYNPFIYARF